MIRINNKSKVLDFLHRHGQLPMIHDISDPDSDYPVYVDNEDVISCVVVEIVPKYYYGVFGTDEDALDEAYYRFFSHPKVWLGAVDERVFEVYKKHGFICGEICNMYEHMSMSDTSDHCPYKIREIMAKDYKTVKKYYQYPVTLKEIKDNAKRFPTSAIYVEGVMVCWCMVHENLAMGPIYTLPEWRGKRLAEFVTNNLVYKLLTMGIKPYFLIVDGNKSSEALSVRVGFKRNGIRVSWIHKG